MIKYTIKNTTKIIGLFAIILIGINFLSVTTQTQARNNETRKNRLLISSGKITQEFFVDEDGVQIETHEYPWDSVVRINITVLQQSNTSVMFITGERIAEGFTPALTNHTLAPGESFEEDYTFSGLNEIIYGCFCTTDSNATFIWSYEPLSVPKTGFIGIEAFFLIGSVTLSIMTITVFSKQQMKNKEE